ncbi:uncharacterized protein LOC113796506 [Dermatophagoides pteronyssinus]|uniref:Uncharacterized protein LOC113796506 n=1 Tax=Dermatophagoides pteronyssinus TaxID=6956 RepID=A0A6P6YCF2_DERPT|nr:uncharacterized protein LOC113796506 [Dermatophagoides pteronyssinus]
MPDLRQATGEDDDDDLNVFSSTEIKDNVVHEEKNNINGQLKPSFSPSSFLMNENLIDLITIEKFWNKQRRSFEKEIFPDFFIIALVKFNIFNDDDQINYQQIRSSCDLDNPKDRISNYKKLNDWIFDQLLDKIRCDFKILAQIIEALRYDDWYVSLAESWQQQLQRKCQQVNNEKSLQSSKLTDSKKLLINFPQPISYKIDLQSKRNEINSHLNEIIKNGKGWIVIYGRKGSGKTVLAESSLSRYDFSDLTDGIYWITIGNLTITDNENMDHEEMLRQELYHRLELLYESIEYFHKTNRPKPERLDNLVLKLNFHFNDHPKSLLVLDDVQSSEIFQYLKFNIPVVITTFNRSVIPNELENVRFVPTVDSKGNVLSIDECYILLKKCINNSKLSHESYSLENIHLSRLFESLAGFPYCIPLIANHFNLFLTDDFTKNETNERLEKLCKDLFETLSSEKNSFPNLDKFLDKTLETMSDKKLVDCFYDFGIFPEPVSFDVLKIIWGTNKHMTANYLDQLSQRSLIIKHTSNVITSQLFTVHDLTASYLMRKLIEKEQLKERHEKLIDSILKDCCQSSTSLDFDLSRLPDDRYIHRCLSYHIYSSGRFDLFVKIFLDLNFLQKKIRFVGPSHVLSDFHNYGRYCRSESKNLIVFQKFIASNTDICDPKVDLLQVALCQSNDSIVYNEARRLIHLNSNFYFDWCNKKNFVLENQHKTMSFKCLPDTTFAALSPDCHSIVTVNDRQINLWNANTGENICSEQNHNQTINHCIFSTDGQFALTTSDDGTAIVWQMTGRLITNSNLEMVSDNDHFEGRRRHNSAKNICLFCYKIIVPNSSKYKTDSTIGEKPSSHALKCGDISSDNRYLLLGTNNGFVYIFSLDGNSLYSSSNIDNLQSDVTCCSFSSDVRYFLFLMQEKVYVYSTNIISNNNANHYPNMIKPSLYQTLEHNQVAHNAVFNLKPKSNKITIFTSSDKNILEWHIKQSKFSQLYRKKKMEEKDCSFRYLLPEKAPGYISICAVSSDGKQIAGFETTRNEIYLWKRKHQHTINCFHTLSSIVTLTFSMNERCLFTLNSRNEIAFWDLGQFPPITSVVELKEDFAAIYDESILSVLTIDKKGFLRLFHDKYGDEDKKFKENLKQKLDEFFSAKNGDEVNNNYQHLLQPITNILCCDISKKNRSIFGTNCGRIFYYDNSQGQLISYRYDYEEIIECRFLPETNDDDTIRLIAISKKSINQYRIDNEIDQLIHYHTYNSSIILAENTSFESIRFISSKLMIILTDDSDFIIFNFDSLEEIFCIPNSRFRSKITNIDSCLLDDCHLIAISLAQHRFGCLTITTDTNEISLQFWSTMKNETPRCCRVCSEFIVIGCDNGNIYLYDWQQLEDKKPFPKWEVQHSQDLWITHLDISNDKRFIISAADSIKLWLSIDGTLLQTFITHGKVSRLFVHYVNNLNLNDSEYFSSKNHNNNGYNSNDEHQLSENGDQINHEITSPIYDELNLNITIAAITDTKSLYILQNYRLNNCEN